MDIESRLAAIQESQREILKLLSKGTNFPPAIMGLKQAPAYTGYSPDHFRRLAVEQRIIAFSRPSGQQKGKLIFRKADLDRFMDRSMKYEKTAKQPGRKRKSNKIRFW